MQSASSRIWIRVTVSISYDDDHNTTGILKHVVLRSKTDLVSYPDRGGEVWEIQP